MQSAQLSHQILPIGVPVPGWTTRPRPGVEPMIGRHVIVEPLDIERHSADLFEAFARDREHVMWTYFSYGPFLTLGAYQDWLRQTATADPYFHAIVDRASGKAIGSAAFMRMDPANGSIEVGHVAFSPALARSTAATEAMALMMARAFELGYRRYEWKCDSLNAKSFSAALRLGFALEGVFRNSAVYRGRNRDTAWFSILDTEWPRIRAALAVWLAPANFDARGNQRARLSSLTRR